MRPATPLLAHLLTQTNAARLITLADCTYIQIESSQGCDTLAANCEISIEDLKEYNPRDSLCTTLRMGERVCCTPGAFPPIESNPDGTCRQIVVKDGDDCEVVAAGCDISLPELLEFNSGGTEFCGGLRGGQRLCCTPGELDSGAAPPSEEGLCKEYVLKEGDTCEGIARDVQLSGWEDVEGFNEGKTWGWRGCDGLLPGTVICVGEGEAPLPRPDVEAECGPRVEGTVRGNGTLGELNPCGGGMCCSFEGRCGTGEEFCGWDE